MKATFKLALLATGSVLALGACDGDSDNNNGGGGGSNPPGQMSLESNFGAQFAAIYQASPNSPAVDPGPNVVPAVDPTKPPVPVP